MWLKVGCPNGTRITEMPVLKNACPKGPWDLENGAKMHQKYRKNEKDSNWASNRLKRVQVDSLLITEPSRCLSGPLAMVDVGRVEMDMSFGVFTSITPNE